MVHLGPGLPGAGAGEGASVGSWVLRLAENWALGARKGVCAGVVEARLKKGLVEVGGVGGDTAGGTQGHDLRAQLSLGLC